VTDLRRVERVDIEVLDAQSGGRESAGEHSWFGFADDGKVRSRVESGETIRPDRGMLAIVDDDGIVVGELSWHMSANGPRPNGECWNLGIWIAPAHRGQGHGSAAQRLGADYLFEHTMMERVEASTEAGNLAEQRALEKAGFTREGVLRHACFRGGEWRDMVVFSRLRGEQ
jgi:RimJ/RimL family protein N-acetyltransferase